MLLQCLTVLNSCITYYEFFKLSKLLGGEAKRYVCHPNIFIGGGGGTASRSR